MRRLALLLVPFALLGCQDDPTRPGTPSGPRADILDDAHGGDTHFYFLTPTVAEAPQFSGTFNPDIWAIVEICELAADGTCGPVIARFTREGEPYYARIRVTEGRREQYLVYWNTAEGSLSVDETYRVRVLSGSSELGHVDVDLVATSGQAAGVDTDEFTPVVLGNWLPIRFRIEEGALCGVDIDCFEGTLTPDGGDFTVPTEFAGVSIPAGAVDAPVNIIIERVAIDEATGPCLPTAMQQAEGCYIYDTDPALSAVQQSGLDEFNTEVAVGACIDPAVLSIPEHHQYTLFKFDPDRADDGVVELSSTAAPFLECTNFAIASSGRPDGLVGLALAGWQAVTAPLAHVFGPSQLRAINLGFGGTTISFSRVGWARALEMTLVAGDAQTGPAGATLPVDPAVRVTAAHFDPEEFEGPPPAVGIEVTFTFTDAAANRTVTTEVTDADGIASVPWVLGAGDGTNTLTASGATRETVVLSAEGLAAVESVPCPPTVPTSYTPVFCFDFTTIPGVWHGFIVGSSTPPASLGGQGQLSSEYVLLSPTGLSPLAPGAVVDVNRATYAFQSEFNGEVWNDVLRILTPATEPAQAVTITVVKRPPATNAITIRNDFVGGVALVPGGGLLPGQSVVLYSATRLTVSVWDCGHPGATACIYDPYELIPGESYRVIQHPDGPVNNLVIVEQ